MLKTKEILENTKPRLGIAGVCFFVINFVRFISICTIKQNKSEKSLVLKEKLYLKRLIDTKITPKALHF